MKRLMSFLLSFTLVFALTPYAIAASDEAVKAANALYAQGLFKGTGTNDDGTPIFDLDKTPTRNQAIIMLVRLFGKESEALTGTWDIPFTDVSENMKPYIGYAYTNGLTNGTSATTYSGDRPISVNQYVSFVLRTLGYESGVDFEVSSALTLSDKLGITNRQYTNASAFTRGDVAIISYRSLSISPKEQFELPSEAEDSTAKTIIEANNITGNELKVLKEDCAKCILGYRLLIAEINDVGNFKTVSEYEAKIKDAYDGVGIFKNLLTKVYQSCGSYDNTQSIKEGIGYIHTAINALPAPKNPNFSDDLVAYLQQFLSVMIGANDKWTTFLSECSALAE